MFNLFDLSNNQKVKLTLIIYLLTICSGICFIIMNFILIISIDCASPLLWFRIFNPDLKRITDFNKNELIFYSVSLNFMAALRGAILTVISLIQIDFVILSAIYYQTMSIFISNNLLKLKTFENSNKNGNAKEPLLPELSTCNSCNSV